MKLSFLILSFLATLSSNLYQAVAQAPIGPPDMVPTPLNPFTPEPLASKIIPPFNSNDPGSTSMNQGQPIELRVVTNVPSHSEIQWLKDGQALPGQTGDTLIITPVTEDDAGAYHVRMTVEDASLFSNEIIFAVIPASQVEENFQVWKERFFTEEERGAPTLSSETADPDRDGIGNLEEYFFGLNPRRFSRNPQIRLLDSDTTSLSFSFKRARQSPDLIWRIEGSNSLKEWFTLSTNQITITQVDETTEEVEISSLWPFSHGYPRFLRLAIEMEP